MDPGGIKSATSTTYSVSDFVSETTDELLAQAKEKEFGSRKQSVLKELVTFIPDQLFLSFMACSSV